MMSTQGREHVILVAFQVEADSRREAHEILHTVMPNVKGSWQRKHSPIICWWVAEDDRIDGSDNDSAEFVPYRPEREHPHDYGYYEEN